MNTYYRHEPAYNKEPCSYSELFAWYQNFINRLVKLGEKENLGISARDRALCLWEYLLPELDWVYDGKPVYKIPKEVLDEFCNTPLDIDIEFMKFPRKSFLIQLPKGNGIEIITRNEVRELTVVLVKKIVFEDIDPEDISVSIVPYFGDSDGAIPLAQRMLFKGNKTVAESIVEDYKKEPEHDFESQSIIEYEVHEKIFNLTTGVILLAGNQHLEPGFDTLNDHIAKYHKNSSRYKNAMKKMRKEQKGVIGKDASALDVYRNTIKTLIEKTAEKRKLQFQHERGGHRKRVRYGKNRQHVKTVWINKITVKPDLPKKLS
jgi:hypothetical protein